MKVFKKVLCSVLAVLVIVSAMAIGSASVSAATLKAPKGVTAINTNIAIQVSWAKVSGAKSYELYRDNKLIGTTAKTTLKDFNTHGGTVYAYKVKAVNGTNKSAASTAFKITRINITVITTIANTKDGVKITWPKRTGATKYIVERKTTGDYTKLGSTTKLSYVDKKAVGGTQYYYRVTCYNSSTNVTSIESIAVPITRLAPVTGVTAVKSIDSRTINIKWAASAGATGYNVYRQKCTDEEFIKIANVRTTSYIDPDIIANPSAYRYYVTAMSDDATEANPDGSESVPSAQRFVQTYGSTPATFDEDRNYHVPLKFNVGDEYADGKALSDYYSYGGYYDVTITDGADVIDIEDDVITALKPGTATVEITVTAEAKNIVDNVFNDALVVLFTNRKVILDITVS